MAVYHKKDRGGHLGAGYEPVGYQGSGGGSDRDADRGSGAADPGLCGADGAGLYPPAAGGRDRGGQGEGKETGQDTDRNAGRV